MTSHEEPLVPDARRIVVLGNSGSGKSTLARRLAEERGLRHLDLDTLAWLPTDPPERRSVEEVRQDLGTFAADHDGWVAEGCYADLTELLVPQADALIFLDLSVEQCQAHARARPWEPHKYPSQEAQDASLNMLLEWIAAYPAREGPMGRRAHRAVYDAFPGRKVRVER